MEIYIDINMIAANSPKETVKIVSIKRSFPAFNTLYIIYARHRAKNPFCFHLTGFLILFKIDKRIWPKMKKNYGEKYEQDGQMDRSKADER
jgi:hypothetical protein